jgi:hypothetical protein
MPTGTTTISRSNLVEPDENHDGGTLLHSRVTALRAVLGDNSNSRYLEFAAIADSTTSDFFHNMGLSLNQLSVYIYTGSGNNLTRVQDPEGIADPWGIAEKGGSEKTTLEITTPTAGGPHTFAVIIVHNTLKDFSAWGDHVAVSSDLTLRDKTLNRVDTTTPRTLTLPAPSLQLYLGIKDVTGTAATNNITLTPPSGTIEGAATLVMASDFMALGIISDGTDYFIV